MKNRTGIELFLSALREYKIDHIFGNPGTSESAITNALALEKNKDFNYFLAVQEGVAMGMADGWARSTGKTAFVNLHIDSGLANGISLLINAFYGGAPIVLTAGNKDIRKFNSYRSNLVNMVKEFTKWSAEVTHIEQLPEMTMRAFKEASTFPTAPTFLSISANVFDEISDLKVIKLPHISNNFSPDLESIEILSNKIIESNNPMIILGDRVSHSNSSNEAIEFSELIGAKVYASSISEVNFPTDHNQYLGMLPNLLPKAKEIIDNHDLVISIGSNVFDGFFYIKGQLFGDNTYHAHIDSSASAISRNEQTNLGILSNPKTALKSLINNINKTIDGEIREKISLRKNDIHKLSESMVLSNIEITQKKHNDNPMSAHRLFSELSAALPEDVIIIDDSVSSRQALMSTNNFKPKKLFGERGGAIGWGMGATMGVKLANPEQNVIGIIGDGSAMMTMQALWTAANSKIPVIYIICNNKSYRVLKTNMQIYKEEILHENNPDQNYFAMDFNPSFNFAELANTFGLKGIKITDPKLIRKHITESLNSDITTVLDVDIDGSV